MTALQMSSASSIGMPSQWSLLLSDLLKSIEEHTMSYADKVRLRCVCASWRSQLPKLHDHPIGTRLPWLLVPFNDNLDSKGASKFYDPLEKKLYELDHLPEAEEKALFKGSTQGGWVVVAETGDKIYVVNPLTRARFQLPPRSKFPDVRNTSDDGKGKWCEVESLGDHVLFLGLNSSTAFSCRDFPGCFKGNQIYCTDDNVSADAKGSGRLFDQGVYSLDEKVFERFPAYVGDTRQVWPAPIWIMPK
ncbi:hypothetical protein F2P56_008853 [Juglans regia]|uniref:KIB1-4 beta-propeller domain-containing protein n=1 Tax=Juglans regia TaxID=51240 RepID=A0A834D1G4_JUGRE|nr:hypothetical protein F2P56_008853 [Juglans regia]